MDHHRGFLRWRRNRLGLWLRFSNRLWRWRWRCDLRRLEIRRRYHGHRNRLRGCGHFNNLMNRGIEQTRHDSTVNHDGEQRRPGKAAR
nr:MAG TPA: hypothetical protein [Caudoviricetes sp.]